MSCEPVVQVEGLSKAYRLFAQPQDRLKHALLWRLGRPYGQEFWALRNVSFRLCKGEMLAVIGRNGGGKSTLLQILAGTLRPTEGTVRLSGRVAALLELGMGFDLEFTGRENIYLNGAILGLSRKEIDAKVDEIIAFADIGDFIDQPVKYYSSGMFVRLAFAVTTGLDPDVLLVDEALAVGDIFFRQKCYRRMEELLQRGTTVILVTHSMADVEMFAKRALLLHEGKVLYYGAPSEAVRLYMLVNQGERAEKLSQMMKQEREERQWERETASAEPHTAKWWPNTLTPVSLEAQVRHPKAVCKGFIVTDDQRRPRQSFYQGETVHIYYEFEMLEDGVVPIGGILIQDERGVFVHGKTTLEHEVPDVPRWVRKGDRIRYHQWIMLNLAAGEYTFEIGLSEVLPELYEQRSRLAYREIREGLARLCHIPKAGRFVVMHRPRRQPSSLTHHGLCDLPGGMEMEVIHPAPSA